MRPITASDIIDWYDSGYDLLVLTDDGTYSYISAGDVAYSDYGDDRAAAYDYVTLDDDIEVQILLTRETIEDREWFPDALTEGGDLDVDVAAEMATLITQDGILPPRVTAALLAEQDRQGAQHAADAAAMHRATKVAEVVAYCGGSQRAAARALGIDQSAVNRLVAKVRQAAMP